MYNDYDDFYYEPSEFEQMVDEFKASLRANVKDEIKEELAQLRKENEANRELRNNWNAKVAELEKEYQNKKYELLKAQREAEAAAKDAKRMRLKELLSDCPVFAYTVHLKNTQRPKCALCDENRYRAYTTPLGRIAREVCPCKEMLRRYYIKKAPIVSIEQYYHGSIVTKYLVNDDSEDGYLRCANEFHDETPFEKIKTYSPLFRDEARARRYVAWLNKREEQKEKMDGGAEG